MQKGLVSSFILNKKHHFSAAEPSRIYSLIDEKREIAKQIIAQIPLVALPQQLPSIEVFTGKEGVKTIAEDELKAKEIFVIWG